MQAWPAARPRPLPPSPPVTALMGDTGSQELRSWDYVLNDRQTHRLLWQKHRDGTGGPRVTLQLSLSPQGAGCAGRRAMEQVWDAVCRDSHWEGRRGRGTAVLTWELRGAFSPVPAAHTRSGTRHAGIGLSCAGTWVGSSPLGRPPCHCPSCGAVCCGAQSGTRSWPLGSGGACGLPMGCPPLSPGTLSPRSMPVLPGHVF